MSDKYSLKELKTFKLEKGDLFKGLSINDDNYYGFGEVYFTSVMPNLVKGWKKHSKMTLNIIVLTGKVRFVIINKLEKNNIEYESINLSEKNRKILTIFPNCWFAFMGLGDSVSTITNIANMPHEKLEVQNKKINEFNYKW